MGDTSGNVSQINTSIGEFKMIHNKKYSTSLRSVSVLTFIAVLLLTIHSGLFAAEVFSPEDVLKTKRCSSAVISLDGKWIAYTVSIQREPGDKSGGAYSNLFLASAKTGEIKPMISGKKNVSSIKWSPDGREIAFLMKKGKKEKTQIWAIRADGGEAYKLTKSKSRISYFQWHPSGKKIAYIATTPSTKKEKKLADKGYEFIFFEENLKHRNLYMVEKNEEGCFSEAEQLTKGITVWDFKFSPDGKMIAAAASEKNLVDYRYMFRKIHLLDLKSRKLTLLTDNPGKLGNYAFSPDGSKLAYTAAKMRKDHAVSQVYVMNKSGGEPKNLTPPNFRGHINWAGWKDNKTILYRSGEGVWPTLSLVSSEGGTRKVILNAKESGIIFSNPEFTKDFKHFAFIGSSPRIPADVFYWQPGRKIKKLTNINPWISERKLGTQEVITYKARDGREIEGILVFPADYKKGKRYPLIVAVHGGPESHYSNSWLSRYSNPAQVLSGKGYAVFYPNYRSSTGYGLEFALAGYENAAGTEFDDIADGMEHLIKTGIADQKRVGLGGGSYGGFAAAWFASYYTRYVRAVFMFVGISDLISKRGTSDIPWEELYVHSGKKLEEIWEFSLRRSPIYYAHQSKTAVLIAGGTADTRVHPSQSLEFYRRLKMNGHPAVRLVRYPGEGHGNRKQPGRIDVLYRHLQWYDWYVKDKKPLDGPMPPLDISNLYGLDLED
jgi:dipeptidyl aminopeptidase/acylaminoacyl peptidase